VGGLVHRVLLRKNHDNILTGMANLACIHLKKGKKKKAGDLATQVIEKTKEDTGETHRETIASLNNLISIYLDS